jgi:hypothetical protein
LGFRRPGGTRDLTGLAASSAMSASTNCRHLHLGLGDCGRSVGEQGWSTLVERAVRDAQDHAGDDAGRVPLIHVADAIWAESPTGHSWQAPGPDEG